MHRRGIYSTDGGLIKYSSLERPLVSKIELSHFFQMETFFSVFVFFLICIVPFVTSTISMAFDFYVKFFLLYFLFMRNMFFLKITVVAVSSVCFVLFVCGVAHIVSIKAIDHKFLWIIS